jgi:hypothetical protein
MNEFNHFKGFILRSGDVDHFHFKRTHLVGFSYIVVNIFKYRAH